MPGIRSLAPNRAESHYSFCNDFFFGSIVTPAILQREADSVYADNIHNKNHYVKEVVVMSEVPPNSNYQFRLGDSLLGAQMLFVAFGALVLVPILTGLDPNVALFTAGIGTLIFQVITKGKVPVFLASSFAFIAPIIYGVQTWGIPATLCGLTAAGVLYVVMSFAIRYFGAGDFA